MELGRDVVLKGIGADRFPSRPDHSLSRSSDETVEVLLMFCSEVKALFGLRVALDQDFPRPTFG